MDSYLRSLRRVQTARADLQVALARHQLFNLPTAAAPSSSRIGAVLSARMLLPPVPSWWTGPVAPYALAGYVAPSGFGTWTWGVVAVDRAGRVVADGEGTMRG
jgi:hypothetical protein